MKKQLLFFWLFLAATALNAQIMIGGGTSTGLMPMSTTYNFNYTQQILPKPGIGAAAAGTITGVTFFVSPTATLSNTSDWTVYMGHTSKGSFASTTDWIPVSSLTQVYQGNVTINNGKVEIVFATPFAYNNNDNLAIAIDENSPGSESALYFYTYSGGSNTAIYYRNNTTNPDPAAPPTGTRTATKSVIQLNGLTVSGVPNCPTVSAPAVAATGVSLLPTITWGLSQNASGYRISMGTAPNGTDVLNNVDAGNVNSYTLSTPLSLNTQYYYTVSSYNSAGNSTTCAERSFTTNTTPDCPTVTAPAASALNMPVLPAITWDSALGASGYLISIGTTSGGTDVANNVDVGNATTFTPATPLMNGTRYYYTVRSYSGTIVSPSCTERDFTTVCGPMPVLFENFDSYATGSIVPQCWARILPPTGMTAGSQTISLTSPASGSRNLYQFTSATNASVIVALPEFSNVNAGTHWLKFKARTSSTALPGALEVGYVTDAADWNSFVNLQTLDITNTTYNDSYYTVVIPNWIPATARLAIKNPSDGKAYYWDDVYWEVIPTCYAPTDLVLTGATSSSLDISWSAPVGSPTPVQGYEYYISPTNTPPNAATPASGTSATTSVTIPGLAGDTLYYVWVRSKCSATDTSNWSPMLEAPTGYCTPVQSGTSTTYYLANATTTGAVTDLNYTATSHQSYVNNSTTVFSAYPTQTFDFFLDGSGTSTYYYYIWVDWNNNLNFDDPGETILATTTKAATHTGSLTIPAGTPNGMYRVRIGSSFSGIPTNACGTITSGNYVDFTLSVAPPPTCVAPINIQITNISYNTATVEWDASVTPPAMGYDVYYSTSNTLPTSATTPQVSNVSALTAPISGLQPVTKYYVWVRSHCAAGDQSAWSAVYAEFTTECQPPAITGTTGETVCPSGATATLTATADAGATITWYDAATGGNVVGTGGTYTTPPLTSTTNYWVTAATGNVGFVGKTTYTSTTGNTGSSDVGLMFDVLTPMRIETVDVYPTAASTGTITISLKDSAGNLLDSKIVNINTTVVRELQTVTLNFNVPAGTGYRLLWSDKSGVNSLIRENTLANFTYPYDLAGVASITSAFTGGNSSSAYYYYFYNWKVASNCESPRTMVTATLDPVCLSTSEVDSKDNVRIYPNPFTDVITISDARNLKSVTVMDASGRMVKTIVNPGAQISLGELKSGLYLLKLGYADGNTKTVKVIKR